MNGSHPWRRWFPTFALVWDRTSRLSTRGRGAWRTSPWWFGESAESRQSTLWRVLRVAIGERVDPIALIDGLADEHRYGYRERLIRLGERLDGGTSLADALEQTPGALSDRQTLAVRFGSRMGSLADVLEKLGEDRNRREAQLLKRLRHARSYGLILLVSLTAVTAFLTIKILPSFQEIYADFELEEPASLGAYVALTDGAAGVAWGWIALAALVSIAWMVRWGRWGRFVRRTVWGRIVPPVAMLRAADVLELLALASDAGRPVLGAVSTLGRYHFDPSIRRKLLFVRNEVEQGAELFQKLAEVGLATPVEARALASAPRSNDLSWALRAVAEQKRNRTLCRVERWIELVHPATVLAVAACALLTAVAILSSLTKIVEALA